MLSAETDYRTLIIPDIQKTESNNYMYFMIHCFEENNNKCTGGEAN